MAFAHLAARGDERSEPFRSLVERADYGVWIADAAADLTFVNRRFSEMLGCRSEEIVGRSLRLFVDHPEPRALPERDPARPGEGFWRFRRTDQTYTWGLVSTFVLRNARNGADVGGFVIGLDDLSICYGPIAVDLWHLTTTEHGDELPLTYHEARLLRYFLKHRGQPLTRGRLLAEIWGQTHDPNNRTLDVHICHLRHKSVMLARNLVTLRGGLYLLKSHPDTFDAQT